MKLFSWFLLGAFTLMMLLLFVGFKVTNSEDNKRKILESKAYPDDEKEIFSSLDSSFWGSDFRDMHLDTSFVSEYVNRNNGLLNVSVSLREKISDEAWKLDFSRYIFEVSDEELKEILKLLEALNFSTKDPNSDERFLDDLKFHKDVMKVAYIAASSIGDLKDVRSQLCYKKSILCARYLRSTRNVSFRKAAAGFLAEFNTLYLFTGICVHFPSMDDSQNFQNNVYQENFNYLEGFSKSDYENFGYNEIDYIIASHLDVEERRLTNSYPVREKDVLAKRLQFYAVLEEFVTDYYSLFLKERDENNFEYPSIEEYFDGFSGDPEFRQAIRHAKLLPAILAELDEFNEASVVGRHLEKVTSSTLE